MSGVCFIDTETLGLDADHQPVWEIGLITPDGTERLTQVAVTERDITLAHPTALEISGFHARYGVDVEPMTRKEAAEWLRRHVPDGAHLAGAVISFDEERLRRLLWEHGLAPCWHYHLVDVETLAAGRLNAKPPWDSEELSRAVGVEPDRFDRHTALGDARWARSVYQAVMGIG